MEFRYGRSAFGRSGRSCWCKMPLSKLSVLSMRLRMWSPVSAWEVYVSPRNKTCNWVRIDRFSIVSLGVNLAHGVMGCPWQWPMTGRGGVVGARAAPDWLDGRCGGGSGGSTLRFWRVLTGRPSLVGPALVLMFDPALTYRRRRALAAIRAVGLWFVLGPWARGRVRPLRACVGARLRTSAPTSGTPGGGGGTVWVAAWG